MKNIKREALLVIIAIIISIPVIIWMHTLGPGNSPVVSLTGRYIHDVGRLFALSGFVFILVQYVLSSRIKLIERGIGLDRLFIIHRMCGKIGLVLILIHPVLLFTGSRLQNKDFQFFTPLRIIGETTLFLLCLAAGAALIYKHVNVKYETWKNVHKIAYMVFPLAFFHSFLIDSDVKAIVALKIFWSFLLCIFVIVMLYKVLMRIHTRNHPYPVAEVHQENQDIWTLYFDGNFPEFKPGQFMIIRLLRDGILSESHPFTISSSPTGSRLSVSIKSAGDFTSTICNTRITDYAYIEAPFGLLSFLNFDADDLILIATGIGITPFISMIRYIFDKRLKKNIVLLWGNKSEKDIIFKEELNKISKELRSLKIVHILSQQDDWQGEKGHVDAEKIKKYVDNFQSGQFFICGAPQMMLKIVPEIKKLGVSRKRIHYEKFALR
jgi:predicted ferric reductase